MTLASERSIWHRPSPAALHYRYERLLRRRWISVWIKADSQEEADQLAIERYGDKFHTWVIKRAIDGTVIYDGRTKRKGKT